VELAKPLDSEKLSGKPDSHASGFCTAELTKPLDSKRLKQGDEVEAKLTAGITTADGGTIPSGSKVIGHVTEAKARSKGDSESTLGIVFDKIERKGGGETPIKGAIQAAAPSLHSGSTGRSQPVPVLTEDSRGVLGIKNLQLGPGGVFTSSGEEVRLGSGTQILIYVTM
jgi:hypothetical protein